MADPQQQAAAEAERIAALCARHGARVVRVGFVVVNGVRYPDLRVECRDNEHAIALLNVLAGDDAQMRPKVKSLAAQVRSYSRASTAMSGPWSSRSPQQEDAVCAQKIQHLAQAITYVDDPEQVFRASDVTLSLGAGNCVNSARVMAALAVACGISARIVGVRPHDDAIEHCAAQVSFDVGRSWHWAETTFAANFGEEPIAAAHRLGILRKDLAHKPCCAPCAAKGPR